MIIRFMLIVRVISLLMTFDSVFLLENERDLGVNKYPFDLKNMISKFSRSFYEQRIQELFQNKNDITDKTYILKEIGDKVAPSGRTHSKYLYLTGYKFLADDRIIDMICKFFDVEVDADGNDLPEDKKVNRKLFAGGNIILNGTQHQLKPLFVSETYLWQYQGTLPTVVLNFNNFTGTSYEAIRQEIALEVRKIYKKYNYLFKNNVLSKRAQNTHDIYANGDVTHDELYNAILYVMRSIYKKYKRQLLFILNDGKDTIIANYKSTVAYVLSDNFSNLKLQILHKYANIVRKNLQLNHTTSKSVYTDYNFNIERNLARIKTITYKTASTNANTDENTQKMKKILKRIKPNLFKKCKAVSVL